MCKHLGTLVVHLFILFICKVHLQGVHYLSEGESVCFCVRPSDRTSARGVVLGVRCVVDVCLFILYCSAFVSKCQTGLTSLS